MEHIQITALAVAEAIKIERERCAKIVENFIRTCGSANGRECAAIILSRIRDL